MHKKQKRQVEQGEQVQGVEQVKWKAGRSIEQRLESAISKQAITDKQFIERLNRANTPEQAIRALFDLD